MSRFLQWFYILLVAALGAFCASGSGLEPYSGRMTEMTIAWMVIWAAIAGFMSWVVLRFMEDFPILFGETGPTWSEMSDQERMLANIRALRRIRDSGRYPGSQLQRLEEEYERLYGNLPRY